MLIQTNESTYIDADDIKAIYLMYGRILNVERYSVKHSSDKHTVHENRNGQTELERIVKEINDYRTNRGGVLNPLRLPIQDDKE